MKKSKVGLFVVEKFFLGPLERGKMAVFAIKEKTWGCLPNVKRI